MLHLLEQRDVLVVQRVVLKPMHVIGEGVGRALRRESLLGRGFRQHSLCILRHGSRSSMEGAEGRETLAQLYHIHVAVADRIGSGQWEVPCLQAELASGEGALRASSVHHRARPMGGSRERRAAGHDQRHEGVAVDRARQVWERGIFKRTRLAEPGRHRVRAVDARGRWRSASVSSRPK
jgi:hypothetical protein